MYTRHSYLLKIRTAAALCAALFLCACNYELMQEDDGSDGWDGQVMTVTLDAGTAAGEQSLTTKAMSDTEQNAIHTLYILAFQPAKDESATYRLKYYATGRPVSDDPGKFNFSLRRSESGADTKLLLVANFNPYPLVNTGMTYDDVQAALKTGELDAAPAFADTGIPMFGFAGNSAENALKITEKMQPLTAKLLRAVARVDVGVGTYNETTGGWDGGVNFTLTEIHVFKPQSSFSLLPLINNLGYDSNGTPSVTKPSPPGTPGTPGNNLVYKDDAIINGTYCESEIYLPEVDFGESATVYDAKHDQRMALVIGGTYNGTTNYYRIDFTPYQFNAMGQELNNVLRNHIYRFSITNVSQVGYTTADAAYKGRPVGLDFTADMVNWQTGSTGTPEADMVVRMNFGGINGTVIESSEMTESGVPGKFKILPKKLFFPTDGGATTYHKPLNYNTMLGEAKDNTFNGSTNGGHYTNVQDALNREGPSGSLVIAPDNAAEVKWRSTPPTASKKDRVLAAKKACWDYRGQGRSDWRLPRLSELMLLWMNKATINISKGFTSLGDAGETYWTGSEGPRDSDKAYTVNRKGEIKLEAKDVPHLIRCVREVR